MKQGDAFIKCYLDLSGLPFHEFVSVLIVLMEIKCKECGVDVVELAEALPGMVRSVNEEKGRL